MVPGLHQTKPYCADAAICCGLAALQLIQILPSPARISRDFAKAIKKCCSSSFKLITLHRGWHWTVYWCSAYPSLHTPCSLWSVRDVGWGGLFQTEWMGRRWMWEFCRREPLGTGHVSKSDEFSEKFQTAFDPPLSFSESYIANFLNWLRSHGQKALFKGPNFAI